jgi:DNA-binding GntR family transcriptional regulator
MTTEAPSSSYLAAASWSGSYRFRMAIEPAALLEPGYQVDPAAFARIRQQQQGMIDGGIFRFSRTRLFEIGAEFHETIVRCSGNIFFIEAIQRQNRLRRLVEYRTNRRRSRLAVQCREHLKLLDLIEAGRREEAAEFLRRHLDVVRNIKVGDGKKVRPEK